LFVYTTLIASLRPVCCSFITLVHTHSDNGACLTLSEIGRLRYNEQKELDAVAYDTAWDAQ
jgi:hypothetical protein